MSEKFDASTTAELDNEGVIFVKGTTNTKGLSTCIFASATKEKRSEVKLRGIGAGANNQMTKAIIIAKGKLAEKGIGVNIDVYFKDIHSKREEEDGITAVEYLITFKH